MANHDAPQSRNEAILQNILGEENEILEPISRIETLLIELLEQLQSSGNNYSEDEHEIGTWIDGSTLYEKTYSITITEDGASHTIDISADNIDKCVYLEVVGINETLNASAGGTMPDTQGLGVYRFDDNIIINSSLNAAFYPIEVYVTIRYTKGS